MAKQGIGALSRFRNMAQSARDAQVDKYIKSYDVDGDGKIQRGEWLEFYGKVFDQMLVVDREGRAGQVFIPENNSKKNIEAQNYEYKLDLDDDIERGSEDIFAEENKKKDEEPEEKKINKFSPATAQNVAGVSSMEGLDYDDDFDEEIEDNIERSELPETNSLEEIQVRQPTTIEKKPTLKQVSVKEADVNNTASVTKKVTTTLAKPATLSKKVVADISQS